MLQMAANAIQSFVIGASGKNLCLNVNEAKLLIYDSIN